VIIGVLVSAALLGILLFFVILFVQRGREGIDLSPAGLLRVYLHVASLAGVVAVVIGLASLTNSALAATAGHQFVYGGATGLVEPFRRCPPGVPGCVDPTPEELARREVQERQQRERQRGEELIRGITFAVLGTLFWGAHYAARRASGGEDATSPVRRSYLLVGAIVFGLAVIVLLPTGVYQALSFALLPSTEDFFRQGAEPLGGGLAALPIWLAYLWLVVREFRRPTTAYTLPGPGPEPAGVGARLGTPPTSGSASAAARPPTDDAGR
jgi:hypothetical protein